MRKLKVRENGQTREGIRTMAVRLLGCHAFTDAPNTSVVLCSKGEGSQVMKGRQRGEKGAEEEAITGKGFPQRWI